MAGFSGAGGLSVNFRVDGELSAFTPTVAVILVVGMLTADLREEGLRPLSCAMGAPPLVLDDSCRSNFIKCVFKAEYSTCWSETNRP